MEGEKYTFVTRKLAIPVTVCTAEELDENLLSERVNARLTKAEKEELNEILAKYPEKYLCASEFIRIAILRQIWEEYGNEQNG